MDYKTMKKAFHERWHEITDTPEVFYAFDKNQLRSGIDRARAAGYDGKFRQGPVGMFASGRVMDELVKLTREHRLELLEAMEDPKFAVPAFKYEMANHEYHINWDGFADIMDVFDYELGEEHWDGDECVQQVTHIVTHKPMSASVAASFNTAKAEYLASVNY